MFGLTDPYKISIGVRQGCVFSPTLFNIFINDLIDDPSWNSLMVSRTNPYESSPALEALLYADDVIFACNLEQDLINAADHVTEWCIKWKMTANIKKCGLMCVKSPRMIAECPLMYKKVKILNKPVPIVTEYKYLGLWLDKKLSWKEHREYHLEKSENLFYKELGKLSNKKLSFWSKLRLIKETFIPMFLWGAEFWASCPSQILPYETLLLKTIKTALHLPQGTPTIPLLIECGITPLWAQVLANKAKYIIRHSTAPYAFLQKAIQTAAEKPLIQSPSQKDLLLLHNAKFPFMELKSLYNDNPLKKFHNPTIQLWKTTYTMTY